jgi:hypothetical protein
MLAEVEVVEMLLLILLVEQVVVELVALLDHLLVQVLELRQLPILVVVEEEAELKLPLQVPLLLK